jgi:hypothetical protein
MAQTISLRYQKAAARMVNTDGVWLKLPAAWGGMEIRMRSLKSPAVQRWISARLTAERAKLGPQFRNQTMPLPDAVLDQVNREAVAWACVDMRPDVDLGEDGKIQPSTWDSDPEIRAGLTRQALLAHFLGDDEGGNYDATLQQALQSSMLAVEQEDRHLMVQAGERYVFGGDIAPANGD